MDTSIFKDCTGRWRTTSLFIEFARPDYPAYFTLGEEDVTIDAKTYPSCKRLYLEHKDPTEHKFARSVFGSFPCWQAISSSFRLREHIAQWREELELHLRSLGYDTLREKAKSGDTQAAKSLATLSTAKARDTTTGSALRSPGRPRKTGFGTGPTPEPESSSPGTNRDDDLAFERVFPSTVTQWIPSPKADVN